MTALIARLKKVFLCPRYSLRHEREIRAAKRLVRDEIKALDHEVLRLLKDKLPEMPVMGYDGDVPYRKAS